MSERLKQALRKLTENPKLDYMAMYPAIVLKDDGQGLVDIQPDDKRLPIMTKIPVRTCLPGMRLKVRRGSRVLLSFEDGDPTKPVVHLWEAGALLSVEITTASGYQVQIDEEKERIIFSTPNKDRVVELDNKSGKTKITDKTLVEIDAPNILLAGGDSPIAREGDEVLITGVQLGNGQVTGKIQKGSSKVKSG